MPCEMPLDCGSDESIETIFNQTRTIAVVGLSPDETKASHRVAAYLQKAGFRIVPIYPKEEQILGQQVYRSLAEVPFAVDLVDMFRKAEIADALVDEAIARGDVKAIWLQKEIINNAAVQKARQAGLMAVQNRCTMVEHQRLAV